MAGGVNLQDPTVQTGTTTQSPPPRPSLPPGLRDSKLQDLKDRKILKQPVNGGGQKTVQPLPPAPTPDTPDKVKLKLDAAVIELHKVEAALKEGAGDTRCVNDFNGIKDAKKRFEQAKKFKAALEDVPRIIRMCDAVVQESGNGLRLASIEPKDEKLVETWTKLNQQALTRRGQLRNTMDGYAIPQGGDWPALLIAELKPFTDGTDEVENAKLRKLAVKSAPTQQAIAEVNQAALALKGAVGKYQMKGMGRASTYFDAGLNGVPMSPEDRKTAEEALNKISEQGIAILNSGGSFAQVKKLMAESGLTEEFWPPQLVQSVQSWRKTQRALSEEKLRKAHQKSVSGQPLGLEDVGSVLDAISDTVSGVHKAEAPADDKDTTGLIEMLSKDPGSVKTITDWLGGMSGGLSGGVSVIALFKNIKEMYETGQEDTPAMQKALKELETATEVLTNALSSTKSFMELAGNLAGGHLKSLMETIVPGIGIAVAGAEFGIAVKNLAKASRTLHQTRGEKREAYAQFANDDVDEAMINAMTNAMGAEKTKVTKNSITCATKGMRLGGSIATTAGGHYGAAVSAGISILATGIDGGSRVIFSGIDWGKARQAKKLLAQAQAGNMEAQVEIFEKSNLYAKMLLAISVKEGGALAKKYVVDRGIEEGDLDTPQSLEILRDAMLGHAEQKNDQEIEDNLAKHLLGKTGQVVGKVASGVGGGVVNLKERAQRRAGKPYVEIPADQLTAFGDQPAGWAAAWKSNKKALVAAGLIDQATGIGAALEKASEADAAAAQAMGKNDEREKLTAAIAAMDNVVATTIAANPVAFEANGSPKRIPHKTALACLSMLRKAVNGKTKGYWSRMDTLPGAIKDWTPAPIADLSEAAWSKFWSEGQTAVGFPKEDGGVAAALKAATTAKSALENEKDRKAARKLAIAYTDALDEANDAVLDVLEMPAVNRQPTVRDALDTYMLAFNTERQRVDGILAGKSDDGSQSVWAHTAFDGNTPATFLSQWQKAMEYAETGGFLAGKGERGGGSDGGFGDAVKAWQGSYDAYQDATKGGDPKGRLQASRNLEVYTGKARQAFEQFKRKQRAAAEELISFAEKLEAAMRNARRTVLDQENSDSKSRKFADKPSQGKTVLSSKEWRNVHDDAVAKGAVLESGTSRKALTASLKALKSAQAAYTKGMGQGGKSSVSAKKKRVLSKALLEAIEDVLETVEMVRGLKRYNENAQMNAYLKGIVSEVEKLKTEALEKTADGRAAAKTTFTKTFTEPVWQTNKKLAINAGIIADEKTGLGDSIKAYLKATAGKDPEAIRQASLDLVPRIVEVRTMSKNTDWAGYMDWMRQQVT